MKQKKNSRENSNLNMRSINNSREVSRRSKGKNRYSFEDESRASIHSYDDENYDKKNMKKKKSSKNMEKEAERVSKKRKRRGRRNNLISKILGYTLASIQFILSAILIVNVLFFNALPFTYVLVLGAVLLILLGITLLSQMMAKGKGLYGKLYCIVMCAILAGGSFYMSKGFDAFEAITGGNTKTSAIVVAVRVDDPAKTIEDAKDYEFAVQYSNSASQIRTTVKQLEEKLGTKLEQKEYASTMEEATALLNGEVDAMIYNSSQDSVLSEHISDYENKIKIIHTSKIVVEIENTAPTVDMTDPFAVYLSGIDVYGDITQESRSDVNIIAVVNPKSHQVLLVTTPRDYHVPIPGISGGQRDKLTHAGNYGVDKSMDTLSALYDLEIPFYGRVNFTSMINIVDALGGLDVYSDIEFTTSPDTEYKMHVEKGMNHFNGKEALAFCRERQAIADGDIARGRHQQAVITAIIKKMMSPAMLRGAIDILESVSDGINTNITMEQIQSMIKTQLRTNAVWNIYSVAAEGTPSRETCYSSGNLSLWVSIPSNTSISNIKNLIDRVEAGEIIEGSTTTN